MANVLIYPDSHGALPAFKPGKVDFALSPGDFCSSRVRKYMFQAIDEWKSGNGGRNWFDLLGRKKAKEEIKKSLRDGKRLLKRLDKNGKVFVVPGNADWSGEKSSSMAETWSFLKKDRYSPLLKGLENVTDCHMKIVNAGDYQIIGYGVNSYTEYPQDRKELANCTKKVLARKKSNLKQSLKRMNSLFRKANGPVIFLAHNQPYGTELDRIRNPASPRDGMHVGSLVARDMIEKHQPVLFVGGHMHENFGCIRMGRTICVNSGFGRMEHVLLKLEGERVRDLRFLGGKENKW